MSFVDDAANNIERMFGVAVPIWSVDFTTNETVCTIGGNEVARCSIPIDPSTKSPFKVLERYDATLLRAYKDYDKEVGDTVHVSLMPHGSFYLEDGDGVFDEDAKMGIDFTV